MLQRHRILVGLPIVVGLAWAASTFAIPTAVDGRPAAEMGGMEPTLLAARYHMRGRTTRFFQRSTGYNRCYRSKSVKPATRPIGVHSKPASAKKSDLAARYHLRKRTTRFFSRAIA